MSTEFDENNDATLSQEELDAVTNIDVRSKGITTLKGVEHFTNLRLLHCGSNQLTSLNVSQNTRLENLYCSENQLIALDVSQNPNLEVLVCYKNQLTTLDVSQNTDLTDLDCSENKLTSLDYTNNVSLTNFKGTDQTADIFVAQDALIFNLASLPGFDPSKAKGWSAGTVSGNTLALPSTKPTRVTYSYAAGNGHHLSVTLKVSYGDVVTIHFDRNGGTGTMADASAGKGKPYTLPACSFNAPAGKTFKTWEVNGVTKTAGSSITVTKDTTVKALWKSSSPIMGDVEINETNFPDATFRAYVSKEFDTDNNGSLSQSERDAVSQIAFFPGKNIKSLEGLAYFRNLKMLECSLNQLTSLDVSYNPALTWLHCDENQLTSLDVSQNRALELLSCYKNQLTSLDVRQNTALETLTCNKNQLTSLDVSQNTALETLTCNKNQLTSLDVSQNRALEILSCDDNQLTSLDVSQNRALEILSCDDNRLTSLDVSQNRALKNLYCHKNQLTSLDCTRNTKISDFSGSNQEYDIQVDGNKLTFDLSSLPEGFEPSKAKFREGDQDLVSGTTLDFTGRQPSTVTDYYTARDIHQIEVTLKVHYRVTVSFDKNGGDGSMANVTANKGEAYTLPACTFTAPEGKTFKGWEIDGAEKAVGDNITVKADTTVKALWDEEKPAVVGSSAAYLTGYPDGSIRPNGFVTRAESAKIIASLKGMDLSAGGQPAFKDLTSSWYTPYINAVVKQGLMRGYMDGTFKPNAPITRAEFAQMIMPLDKVNSAAAPFADVKGHWAEKAINQAYGNGRIKGYPDGSFRPDGQITRAEAVTICNNFFNRKADKAGLEASLKNPGKIKTFTDLDKSHWAYYEILEAANAYDDQNKA